MNTTKQRLSYSMTPLNLKAKKTNHFRTVSMKSSSLRISIVTTQPASDNPLSRVTMTIKLKKAKKVQKRAMLTKNYLLPNKV